MTKLFEIVTFHGNITCREKDNTKMPKYGNSAPDPQIFDFFLNLWIYRNIVIIRFQRALSDFPILFQTQVTHNDFRVLGPNGNSAPDKLWTTIWTWFKPDLQFVFSIRRTREWEEHKPCCAVVYIYYKTKANLSEKIFFGNEKDRKMSNFSNNCQETSQN